MTTTQTRADAQTAPGGAARLWFSVALGAAAVLLIGWLATLQPAPTRSPWEAPRIASYSTQPGSLTVTLSVESFETDRVTGARVDFEDENNVWVVVDYEYLEVEVSPESRLDFTTVSLTLDRPLGDRILLNINGDPIPHESDLREPKQP